MTQPTTLCRHARRILLLLGTSGLLAGCDQQPELHATQAWLVQAKADARRQAEQAQQVEQADAARLQSPARPTPHAVVALPDPFAWANAEPALTTQASAAMAGASPELSQPEPLPAIRALGVMLRADQEQDHSQAQVILQIDDRILRLRTGQSLPQLPAQVVHIDARELHLRWHGQALHLPVGRPPGQAHASQPDGRQEAS